ncbi:BamA/TamA family outer membrane protein [Chitinispirillales bacterium ANBcel5]|uniref:BamA/OMP85 family outer membrane protein n=1 Tax=Cellulosispirillum alkaliphilum TaxID=3039283 RepID=UPI002A4FC3D7|nr:BamA/TamA family outer membrane protein [Chitinispirillales bacterium ANBcel5]
MIKKQEHLLFNYRIIMVVLVLFFTAHGQWRVRRVNFEGNREFLRRELLSIMEMRPQWPFNRIRYTDFRLRSDLDIIEAVYRGNGFLSVSVDSEVDRDSSRNTVTIMITIEEGPQTLISDVTLITQKQVLDSTVLGKLSSASEKPLKNSYLIRDRRKLRELLAQRGYQETLVETDIEYDTLDNKAAVKFTIKEGPLIEVGEIELDGVEKLRSRALKRELSFERGDTLTLSKIRNSERRLYRTGLLSYAAIEPVLNDTTEQRFYLPDSAYKINVAVNEADFFRIQAGFGYGTDDGFRSSLRSSYSNLFRLGHKLTLSGRVSQKVQRGEMIYSTPWLFRLPLFFDGSVYYNRYNDPDVYVGVFDGLRLGLSHETDNNITLRTWAKWENVRSIEAPQDDKLPLEIPGNPTHSLGLSVNYDTRNDLFSPTNGIFTLFETEVAGMLDRKSNQFLKFRFDTRFYSNYRATLFFSSALRTGWINPYGRSEEAPVQEQFFAGGRRTVRGFRENHLAVQSDGDPLKGNFYVVANILDFRFPLFWWFEGALFLDAGNVWRNLGDIKTPEDFFRKIRWAAGPGLRVKTPLMVVRFDAGFKLDRRSGESAWEFHIDIGQPF